MKVFGTFRLDTVNHSLWRGEERVSLPPRAFDVLRYLVENADRLVTQDELLEALWPETYVNPEVIKKYVLGIRKVLGDQTSKPVFVATFPRRGYQFITPVREESDLPLADAAVSGLRTIVGREGASAGLNAAFNKTLQGQRQIVFITGEAGIGKTTLVDAFQQTAASRAKVKIARGQCVEGFGGKEAYYPILEALGQLFRDSADCSNFQIFAKRAPTWLVQFPSLVSTEQREALEREIIGATRERMVREICEAFETITAQNPLILILEDLHWVDPSTLDFISALARRRGPAKLLLVATYRPAEVIISRSPLKALKQDLVIHNLSHEISLERLEESDVAEYLAIEFTSGEFPAGFAKRIYRHSGGNALFMVTILQDMVKNGRVTQCDGTWRLTVALEDMARDVPETLDQFIEAQFRQLTEAEQCILRSASVAGERFSVWAIAPAAELEISHIEDTCEELAERLQFIKCAGIHELPTGQISAHYEFRHSLYREVLYRRISGTSRSKLHRILAQRLQAFCDPCEQELATELAQHFEEGRDYEQAIRYLIMASENAAKRFAYRDSIEILEHALELVTKLGSKAGTELEIRVLEAAGDAHFALGALQQSAEAYIAAATRAEQAGLKADQAHALALDRQQYGQAIEHFKHVHDPAVSTKFFLHWAWRLMARLESGRAWLLSGNIRNARTVADELLKPVLATDDPYLHALTWELNARVAMAEGDWTGARGHIQQAIAIVGNFEILVAAWQTHATAWRLFQHTKELKAAKTHLDLAKTCVLEIANTFAPDEPLGATFLSAPAVARILGNSASKVAAG